MMCVVECRSVPDSNAHNDRSGSLSRISGGTGRVQQHDWQDKIVALKLRKQPRPGLSRLATVASALLLTAAKK